MTSQQVAEIFAILTGAYPRQVITAENARVYATVLGDLQDTALRRAVIEHVATSQWFPSIAELRAAVVEASCTVPPLDLAWAEVSAEVARVGASEVPQFSDPAIDDVVRAIGWREICLSDKPGIERAAFREMYTARRARDLRITNVGPLAGALGISAQIAPRSLPLPVGAKAPPRSSTGVEFADSDLDAICTRMGIVADD